METTPENSHEPTEEMRRSIMVTHIVTIMERWYRIEAASQEAAMALLEDGLIERDPDKEDAYNEIVEAEEEKAGGDEA